MYPRAGEGFVTFRRRSKRCTRSPPRQARRSRGLGLGVGDGVGLDVGGCDEDGAADRVEDAPVDGLALVGGGGAGVPDDAGSTGWRCGELSADVTLEGLGREFEVACAVHADELRVEKQHEGCFGFAGVEGAGLGLEQVGDVDIPDGDDAHAGGGGDESGERVEVGLVAVSGNEDELGDALGFPGSEELVERAVERFLAERSRTGVVAFAANIDAVVERGCAEHAEFPGEVEREVASDEDVGAERQVRSVLLHGADGNDESRFTGEVCRDVDPAQLIEGETLVA